MGGRRGERGRRGGARGGADPPRRGRRRWRATRRPRWGRRRPPCGCGRRRAARPPRRPPWRRAGRACRWPAPATTSISVARGSSAAGSPPWACTIRRHTSMARPSARAAAGSASSSPARSSISRARSTVSSTTSGGPPPASTSTASTTSRALPAVRPSGTSICVSSAVVRTPWAAPELHHHLGQLAGLARLLHERAAAHLHVEHERLGALGDLLRHDRAGDERDRLDRAGDVAQRVELAVGRRQVGAGRVDHRADVAEDLRAPRRPRAWIASRGSSPSCRWSRRCGRGPARRSAARPRRTPRRAARAPARSCRRPRRWSACRRSAGRRRTGRPACRWRSSAASTAPAPAAPCPRNRIAISSAAACSSTTSPRV